MFNRLPPYPAPTPQPPALLTNAYNVKLELMRCKRDDDSPLENLISYEIRGELNADDDPAMLQSLLAQFGIGGAT